MPPQGIARGVKNAGMPHTVVAKLAYQCRAHGAAIGSTIGESRTLSQNSSRRASRSSCKLPAISAPLIAPIEAVMDDQPRRDSVIFNVNVWQSQGPAPSSIWQVLGRQKNIQYASRAESHIARQKQLHRMRHIIRRLKHHLPADQLKDAEMQELTAHGCGTTMHVVRLLAPEHDGDDYTKDIDFTPDGVAARRDAGYADARGMLSRRPWLAPVDPMEGVIIHQNAPMTERLAKS